MHGNLSSEITPNFPGSSPLRTPRHHSGNYGELKKKKEKEIYFARHFTDRLMERKGAQTEKQGDRTGSKVTSDKGI